MSVDIFESTNVIIVIIVMFRCGRRRRGQALFHIDEGKAAWSGGRWDNTRYAGTAFACAGYDIALANQYRGARLAYPMSDDAL